MNGFGEERLLTMKNSRDGWQWPQCLGSLKQQWSNNDTKKFSELIGYIKNASGSLLEILL